jgi:hypothetical protein
MLDKLPWDLAPQLPWHVFTSPAAKWAVQPSFVIGEYLFIAYAVLALGHALLQGERRRQHVLAWVAALVAGTANDLIFMALPLVDNFWQAQATIMLTPRLPLYIPCVYIGFMYTSLVSVWRLNLPPLGRAALTGLAASVFYAPYDIVGAKFLWWTWHDSDLPIANRLLGAPIGSTMWIITFTASFSWLLNRVLDSSREPRLRARTFAKGLGLVAACSSLLMVVQMTVLQQLDGGVPGIRSLCFIVIAYLALVGLGFRRAQARQGSAGRGWPSPHDRLLNVGIIVYFTTLVIIGIAFDPATHRSASMHQTYGPCHEKAIDIAGHTRYKFLCAQDFDEDFTFDCVASLPAAGSDWYTVCGRPHRDFRRFLLGVGALGALGILLYSFLLGTLRRRRPIAV